MKGKDFNPYFSKQAGICKCLVESASIIVLFYGF